MFHYKYQHSGSGTESRNKQRQNQPVREMDIAKMLHMNGGLGDKSYANNSLYQQKAISMAWPIIKETMEDYFSSESTLPTTTLSIADLGCSSGPNALLVITNLIKQMEEIRRQNLHNHNPLDYQIFLNDLPGNDFNAIFISIPSFLQNLKTQIGSDHGLGSCFINGVPGSFYGRLFPTQSLHFVHSSYSLQWLSQVPKGIESNKGNIFMGKTSPKAVLEAYYNQHQNDFSTFLKCRAEELVSGGRMVLTILGRTAENPSSKEGCYVWELLNLALKTMVTEGMVEEEKVDSFNIPNYMPSPLEVKSEILKEGSFAIDDLQVSRTNWNLYSHSGISSSDEDEVVKPSKSKMSIIKQSGYEVAKTIRAVAEPLMIPHFGEDIMDELFSRYSKIIAHQMSKEEIEFINLTVSLTKIIK